MTAPQLSIVSPPIVLVAPGKSTQDQANARGRLFEKFIARLFEAYGCEAPTPTSINVRSNGFELDIATKVVLTREDAIAECKAYSSRIRSEALSTFYGKLGAERLDRPNLHGWFVAIPGLVPDGHELARKLTAGDTRFRFISADDIYSFLIEKEWIEPIEAHDHSDHGALIAAEGLFAIAKRLDPETRLAASVEVAGSAPVPRKVLDLLADSEYAAGLPVADARQPASPAVAHSPVIPTLVSVASSTADFEYQLPASPAFFVGRAKLLEMLGQRLGASTQPLRVVVLNAQSGWGKSSLALRFGSLVESRRGFAAVYDSRTASSVEYVLAALREAVLLAADKGVVALPSEPSFASLTSTLRTLQLCRWLRPGAPLLVFFDQFENVFRDTRLTHEFRDLALAVREVRHPLVIGFAWKTDLVGWTEKYPYQLRDEIRAAAEVVIVEPFGPSEVGTLLSRLSKASGTNLSGDLRQRLREYSQGLPWLLKKLASHILTQLQAGTSEATLLQESLNVQRLFEQDLSALEVAEIDALKLIAREAPVAVSDLFERVPSDVVQSLVDQRLVVRVGERLDVYWDIFREFLITGKVAIEETYILRLNPLSTSNVLREIILAGGEHSAAAVVEELNPRLFT